MDLQIFLLLLVSAVSSATQTSTYLAARDYLSVMSENYPGSYPEGPERWEWQWRVGEGQWAVVFRDFDLACNHHDTLLISQPSRNLTFHCLNMPSLNYPYYIDSTRFSMRLQASGYRQTQPKGFNCQVLYGASRGALQSKIDDMQTRRKKEESGPGEDSGSLRADTVVLLVLVLVVLVVVLVGVGVLLRRRQLQQSTNTSVHLNIGAIRRDSSVSYTRNGNGPPAGMPRSRLDSSDSLSPEPPRSGRPVKRSDSNASASWATRAEMNGTSVRHPSSSSQGHQATGGTTVPNIYTPCPGDTDADLPCTVLLSPSIKDSHKTHHKGGGGISSSFNVCRLSTICEESCGPVSKMGPAFPGHIPGEQPRVAVSKLSGSFPVPLQGEQSSLAVANTGYMLMTSCAGTYVNYGHE